MNNQKTEKAADHEEGDHAQPINLVAPRPPTPSTVVTTFSGLTAPVANQPVALRPHNETSKPGLMTLYFRTPTTTRPSGPGHIMSPVMGAQVASQHFATKQGNALKSFKGMRVGYYQDKLTDKTGSEFNIKVIRVPTNDGVQSQSSSTTPSATTLTPGILPNALAGNTSRHIIPAAVHPGISTGSSVSGSMASIIKGGHQVSQVSHAMHQPFSSHVPRGPAAVASISAGPRSGVATPIVRAPHSSSTMTLASSMISPNAHVRVRSQAMTTGRTPVASSAAYTQVIDLQKNSVGHSLASNQAQIGQASRSLDMTPSIRTGLPHPSSITIAKPINISQPIVQHLQQVSEKSCLKAVSGITSTTTVPPNSTPAHQNTTVLSGGHSSGGEVHSVCIVPTITRATVSSSGAYTTGIVQFPAAAIPQHVPALRPSLVQPQALTTGMNISASQGNQAFAVIAKSLPTNNQSMTLATPACRTPVSTTVVVSSCGSVVTCVSTLTPASARVLNTSSSVCQAAIPIAKVYPQPLPTATQVCTTTSALESVPSSFVTQPTNLSNVSTLKSVTTSPTTATTTAVSNVLHTSPVMKRSDSSTSVRFAPLTKQQVASGTSFTVPSASYLYDQCPGTLAVHPYSVASTNQGFSTALPASHIQTFALSQHGSNNITTASHQSVCVPASSSSSMQPMNSLMVAVDSRHVALPYNRVTIGGGKTVTELATHVPTSSTTHTSSTSANLVALSQASSSHNVNHSQGNMPNHLSPRPSILRKRPATEGVTSVAKRNLLSSLCGPEPGSPNSDFTPTMNLSTTALQKSTNGQLRENGVMFMSSESENCLSLPGPATAIKKEPGVTDENQAQLADDTTKDSHLIEASPRKKPRKQLLAANELIETHSSDGDEQFEMKANKETKADEESVKWVTFCKRPSMSLLPHNRQGWKSRHNHFIRYSDVKPKEEKPTTVTEYANQKGITDETNGWKIHHLTGQMEDLIDCEESVCSRLSHWLELETNDSTTIINISSSSEDNKIVNKLMDLVKGNLQRSKIAQEQASESQQQIIKILDHKPNILDILSKYASRRQSKKKEKT